MRHWCATARMIEWDYNINRVSNWLGHSNINTTTKYVHIAQEYYEPLELSPANKICA